MKPMAVASNILYISQVKWMFIISEYECKTNVSL